jgi:hypothetical protein
MCRRSDCGPPGLRALSMPSEQQQPLPWFSTYPEQQKGSNPRMVSAYGENNYRLYSEKCENYTTLIRYVKCIYLFLP